MKHKLYDYGVHFEVSKFGYRYEKEGWYLTGKGKPATTKQKRELHRIGWLDPYQKCYLTKRGAWLIIQEIRSSGWGLDKGKV